MRPLVQNNPNPLRRLGLESAHDRHDEERSAWHLQLFGQADHLEHKQPSVEDAGLRAVMLSNCII